MPPPPPPTRGPAPTLAGRLALALLLAALCACEGPGTAPPALDGALDQDLAPPDADLPAPGAACPQGRCAAGADCVAGRCRAPCAGDGDCPADQACVGAAAGLGVCALACADASDCLPAERCAPEAPGRGRCLAPGLEPAGARCAADADCDSRVCSAGVCLAVCAGSEGCAADEACLPLHTQGVCVTAGPGSDEALCARGADCASGVCRGGRCSVACPEGRCPHDRICRDYSLLSLCERPCAGSAACGEGAVCALVGGAPQCLTRGPGAPEAACGGPEDCASGVCTAEGRCAAPCGVDGSCPAGQACVADLSGRTCRPAGLGALGDPCAEDRACASGLCAAGRCGAACPQGTCPAGLRCLRFLSGSFCFAPCADTADCPAQAYCEGGFAEGAACFWRGPTAADGPCGRHADCASGRCAGGRCLPDCPDGRCPGERRCLAFPTGAWCSPQPRPLGAACATTQDCAEGLGCVAGICAPGCAAGCPAELSCAADGAGAQACHPRCSLELGCRPGAACVPFDGPRAVCMPTGALPAEAPCDRSADCRDGLCLDGRCRAGCPGGQCLGGNRCVAFEAGAWCLPAGPGAPGAACGDPADCAGAPCAGLRCAPPCGPAGACAAPEARCRPTRLGPLCLVPCDPLAGEGCAPGEACAPEGGGALGRCAPAAGAAPGAPCGAGCAPPGRCVASAGEARCWLPCAEDAACGPGAACVRLAPGDALGICLPAGPAPTGAPCQQGPDCQGGACAAPGGRCGRPCARDADCRSGDRCVGPDRDPFTADGRCAPPCAGDGDCPEGLACRVDGLGRGACWQPTGP